MKIRIFITYLFLMALLGKDGLPVYFIERDFISGEVVSADRFDTKNRGYFVKGYYIPMEYSSPYTGARTLCPRFGNLINITDPNSYLIIANVP